MNMVDNVYIIDLGLVSGAGIGKKQSIEYIMAGNRSSLVCVESTKGPFTIGKCPVQEQSTIERLQQLIDVACAEIQPTVEILKAKYGSHRIAVIVGSTDNGSALSFMAVDYHSKHGSFPAGYSIDQQLPHRAGQLVRDYLGLTGPVAGISTACTSGSSALITGMRFLSAGLCDAVVAGGADIISSSVLFGFSSLEAIDRSHCKPLSKNRAGINLGEGAALLVLSKKKFGSESISLVGAGETSDAHHMTAPEATGTQASRAMLNALDMAGLAPGDIDYINLHGTATLLNDAMESRATHRIFGSSTPVSSTKGLIGHTLGAAGALEAAFCWLTLSSLNEKACLPIQPSVEVQDADLPILNILSDQTVGNKVDICMSNNFAFGGCNTSLILRKST